MREGVNEREVECGRGREGERGEGGRVKERVGGRERRVSGREREGVEW